MEYVLDRVVVRSHSGAFIGNTRVTDLIVDDAKVFAESLEASFLALYVLYGEAKALWTSILFSQDQGTYV